MSALVYISPKDSIYICFLFRCCLLKSENKRSVATEMEEMTRIVAGKERIRESGERKRKK